MRKMNLVCEISSLFAILLKLSLIMINYDEFVQAHSREPLIGEIVTVDKLKQDRDLFLDSSNLKWSDSASSSNVNLMDEKKTRFVGSSIEGTMSKIQSHDWSPSLKDIATNGGGANQRNKTNLSRLVYRMNLPNTDTTTTANQDEHRANSDNQWVHSATTTARPAYNQIPRPVLFEDVEEVDDLVAVFRDSVPMKI